ncbi:MAG: DUF2206 domain-containing protein [Methanobacteriaceae archaeon]|nr:DUF2206 domain-containing protein [Methanobacteriaceae archaeon]
MQINSPLKMNDWKMKEFLIFIFSIQTIVLCFIGLEFININIPILREIFCFFYISFIPGIIFLRILKIHDISQLETLIYSIGISITFSMFLGLILNIVLPFFGFMTPLSILTLMIAFSLLIIFLTVLSYIIDNDFSLDAPKKIEISLSPWIPFFALIPFLSVISTYLMNFNNDNSLQIILIVLICILPIILLKWVPQKFYPFAILTISISLLLHTSLISNYLWGSDSWTEYYFSNLVLKNLYWNNAIPHNYNAMLSVSLLFPIYSSFLDMKLNWIMKIVIPLLFSIIPLGLYEFYKKQTNTQTALLASILFMFTYTFYNIIPTLGRQEIAEIFLMLTIFVMFSKIDPLKKSILLILFGMSLIVSHYAVALIFIIILIISIIIKFLGSKIFKIKEKSSFSLNKTFIGLLLVFSISWFIYASHSSIFINVVTIGGNILTSLTDILNPSTSQGYNIIQSQFSLLKSIEKYLYLIIQCFIGIGILSLFKNKIPHMDKEYKLLSIASFLVALFGIVLPFFASALNSDRLYHITLFFLAPFFIIGLKESLKIIRSLSRKKINLNKKTYYLAAILLISLFLFSSSLIYQISDQSKVGRFALDKNVDFLWINDQEMGSINWINNYRSYDTKIYADMNKAVIIRGTTNDALEIQSWNVKYFTLLNNSYLYLGSYNLQNNQYAINFENKINYMDSFGFDVNTKMNKIYDNNGSMIFVSRSQI